MHMAAKYKIESCKAINIFLPLSDAPKRQRPDRMFPSSPESSPRSCNTNVHPQPSHIARYLIHDKAFSTSMVSQKTTCMCL